MPAWEPRVDDEEQVREKFRKISEWMTDEQPPELKN
jgi:hypothetical protein